MHRDSDRREREEKRLARNEYPEHPRVGVGGVVINDGKVLLVLRGKPPSGGEWAIPGGSVELGETLKEAVEREIREETGLIVQGGKTVHVFDGIIEDDEGRVRYHYVIVDLMADFVGGELEPGDDALDAAWFHPEELTAVPANRSTLNLLRKLGFAQV
jgi:ADP-ribose pyrophosphatase